MKDPLFHKGINTRVTTKKKRKILFFKIRTCYFISKNN